MDQTSQTFFENHVLSVCSALGSKQENEYITGDEAIDCLRDLKRFLRMDEQYKERNAHLLLGKWNVIQSDLIPLIVTCVSSDRFKLAISACEVIVPLTWPLETTESIEKDHYLRYKVAFLQKGFWASIVKIMMKLIAVPISKRSENDQNRLRLLFCLVRNVLAIEDPKDSVRSSTQTFLIANCHEQLVELMYKEELFEFLISLASSSMEPEFKAWNALLVEIFFHVFYGYKVQDLRNGVVPALQSNLQSLLEKEKYSKKTASTRHSRFGGMFSVKSNSGKQVNMSKLPSQTTYAFDSGKTHTKPRKKNLTLELYTEKHFLNPSSAVLFHKIATSFLENGFNSLMASTKRDFDIQLDAVKDPNYMHYFFLLGYFIDFYLQNAKEEIELDQITNVIHDATVFFILRRIHMYREEKKWKDLYFCVNAMEKFTLLLQKLDQFSVDGIKQASLQIQSKFFYEEAYLEMMVSILKDTQPRSRKFLECAVNLVNVLFQLLETNWNSEDGMVVRKKKAMQVAGADVQDSDNDDEYESYVQTAQERVFSLSRFEHHFGYESIIDSYCDLLREYESLSEHTLKSIVRMFNRIIDTRNCNKEALFYNAAYFYLFDEILSNPISRTPAFEKLREFILLVTSQFITKVEENPMLLMDLFFSKTRRDCLRIQNGDNEELWPEEVKEALPDVVDLNEQFSVPSSDPVLRCDQVRRLSAIIAKSTDGDEFLRWLSKSLRSIMYDDLEDLEDLELSGGIFVSHFIEVGAAPSFVEAYIKNEAIAMLLHLIGFDKISDPDTFVFPSDVTIQMIEAVERAKMFARREPPPPKKSRKRAHLEGLEGDESEGEKPQRKKKESAKEAQYKSEMFVVDSDDDIDDTSFFAKEAELRKKMDECGGNLAVNEQVEEPVQIVANGESDDETQVEAPKPVKKKVAPIQKVQRPKQTLKKVSQARLALDSDSDAEITIEPVKEAKPPQQKRARIIDSDSE